MRTLTVILLLLALLIGLRVEILNARAHSPLPLWLSLKDSESGFRRSEKIRMVPLTRYTNGHDRWKAYNDLIVFGRYWTLLQFPLVFTLAILLVRTRKRYKGRAATAAWIAMGALTIVLALSAFFRDYTYGTYGM